MSRAPPSPVFVHRGIHVTCMNEYSGDDGHSLIIGTSQGECKLCNISSFKLNQLIYKHENNRIMGVSSQKGDIFVHVRNEFIVRLRKQGTEWQEVDKIGTLHYGFCSFVLLDGFIVMPSMKKELHVFNRLSLDDTKDSNQIIAHDDKVAPLVLHSQDDVLFIGDDSGKLTIVEGDNVSKKSWSSEPIFCITSSDKTVAVGSSVPPIRLLRDFHDDNSLVELNYPPESTGCSCLTISPSGHTLLAGFWNGVVRGFSLKKKSIILYLDFHQKSLTTLCWFPIGREKKDVIATSSEDHFCFWSFK